MERFYALVYCAHVPVAGAGTHHYYTGLAAHELRKPTKNCSPNGSNANAGGQSETFNNPPFHLLADRDNSNYIQVQGLSRSRGMTATRSGSICVYMAE